MFTNNSQPFQSNNNLTESDATVSFNDSRWPWISQRAHYFEFGKKTFFSEVYFGNNIHEGRKQHKNTELSWLSK